MGRALPHGGIRAGLHVDQGEEELLVGPDAQMHPPAPHQILGPVPLLKLKVVPAQENTIFFE